MGQIGRRLSLGTSDIALPLTKVDDAHDQRVRSARLQTFDYDCVVRALVSLDGIEQFVPGGIATFSVAIGTFVEFEAIPVADTLAMMTRRIQSIFSLRSGEVDVVLRKGDRNGSAQRQLRKMPTSPGMPPG
jgi:hypothetical protein